ncbi:MAG TPA: hypothetical protein VF828_00230, partial [Patescibacteria group bacterium]
IFFAVIGAVFAVSSLAFKDAISLKPEVMDQLMGILTMVVSYFMFRVIKSVNKQKVQEGR